MLTEENTIIFQIKSILKENFMQKWDIVSICNPQKPLMKNCSG